MEVSISLEWLGIGYGLIDFRIPQKYWGIELLLDGNRLREHCQRFEAGSKYSEWIGDGLLEDWLLIDLRHATPTQYGMTSPATLSLPLECLLMSIPSHAPWNKVGSSCVHW